MKLQEVTDFPKGCTIGDSGSVCWKEMRCVEGNLPRDRIFYTGFDPIRQLPDQFQDSITIGSSLQKSCGNPGGFKLDSRLRGRDNPFAF
jgi:hypothetical protein